jgi:hypothetical protein
VRSLFSIIIRRNYYPREINREADRIAIESLAVARDTLKWQEEGAKASQQGATLSGFGLGLTAAAIVVALIGFALTSLTIYLAKTSLDGQKTAIEDDSLSIIAANRLSAESLMASAPSTITPYFYSRDRFASLTPAEQAKMRLIAQNVIASYFVVYVEAQSSKVLAKGTAPRHELDSYIVTHLYHSSALCYFVDPLGERVIMRQNMMMEIPNPYDLYDPDFVRFAVVCGCRGDRVSNRDC